MGDNSIYSKRCWYNEALVPATVVYNEGVITAVLPGKREGAFDAGNSILMPGVIDAHVHVNEPGRTEWEGCETATLAAAKAGTTTIIDMPLNADPVTTTVAALREKLAAANKKMVVNCGFYGGLVPGNIDHLQALIENGVMGIKCFLTHSGIDEFPNVIEDDLNLAMPIIAKCGATLLVHCELLSKNVEDVAHDPGNYLEYMRSRPAISETSAVELMISLCRKHRCSVHIVHVSSAESNLLIKKAKAEGLPLTAETCIHYIYFNAEEIPDNKPIYKCAPPIRDKDNNDILKQALNSGTLDFLTTDHSPAPPEIKEIASGNIMKAWGGIAGLQFLLPASWSACREVMSLENFIPLLTSKPALFLGLDKRKGKIEKGYDADIVVWNPDEAFLVSENDIEHRHKISPYIGENLFGIVEQTIVNGQTVYNKNAKHTFVSAGKVILKNRVSK